MKKWKYIYDKYSPDTVPCNEYNEFHALSVFLGAYLEYCSSRDYASYAEYVAAKNLKEECLDGKFRWPYVTKAHLFVRNRLNKIPGTDEQKSIYDDTYISKRQIRKLGYCGIGSPRMCPVNAELIQNEIFRIVFYTEELEPVKLAFLEYLHTKFQRDDPDRSYLTKRSGSAAANSVFRNFISFLFHLLSGSRGDSKLLNALEVHTYAEIQQDLNMRG